MNMIRIRRGKASKILSKKERITVLEVTYGNCTEKAINYNYLTGPVMEGDIVLVNTTSNHLKLGSGGYSFVIINETRGQNIDLEGSGHIMKLRYTPYQVKCYCASEETSSYRQCINSFKNLDGMLVITGELHSMLAPTACSLKLFAGRLNIAYIMTDGASLPIDFSFVVNSLKSSGVIAHTITAGNAFGGDYEAVNIYDALVIAKSLLKCPIAIITMGPGIVGTGTKYGFTGIEQGNIVDCINTLKGIPLFIPRISFADRRKRHYGISHHTITVLSEITNSRANVIFPVLEGKKKEYIEEQISKYRIGDRHDLKFIKCPDIFKELESFNITFSTMGRGLYEDREFFLACISTGYYAASLLKGSAS